MEETRCKITSKGTEDLRCLNLLERAAGELEDLRCKGLDHRIVTEIDDSRWNSVVIQMEDPRCGNLRGRW